MLTYLTFHPGVYDLVGMNKATQTKKEHAVYLRHSKQIQFQCGVCQFRISSFFLVDLILLPTSILFSFHSEKEGTDKELSDEEFVS